MTSSSRASVALLLATSISLGTVGCSAKLPAPSVNNPQASVPTSTTATSTAAPALGRETMISNAQLVAKLKAEGLKVSIIPRDKPGVFKPAKFVPLSVDGTYVQTYRFKDAKDSLGAARTVENDGFVLGYTPGEYAAVNWAGWPAFFRSGDLIVIFITAKDDKARPARDKRIFNALKKTFGPPFIGGQTPPASLSGTPPTQSATSSVPATS